MIDVGSAVGYLLLDSSGFQNGFKTAFESMKTFQDQSSTALDKFQAAGSALTSMGAGMTKSVTLPLTGLGTAMTVAASSFQSAMSNVAAIAGMDTTGKEFEALSDKAKEMGAKTKFSASEAADAFSYMAMAGWKAEDMLDGIEGIMNLAAASGEDLALTSDIVTDALTAFGLSAKDSSQFADVLAAASSNANTNVALLGESFKYVAPVAGALKYSAEDTSIALGLMANSGIKASSAGTALRAALTNMVSPTKDMAGVMDKYGISLQDAQGNMKPFMTVMQDLRNNMGTLSEAEKAQAASTLFGKEAMSGMLAIINASDADFDKLSSAIYNASGTADTMSETMQDNLSGSMTILKSALEGLAISFGDLLLPMLTNMVKSITHFVDKLNSMSDGAKKFLVTAGLILAALGPMFLIFGKVAKTISTVTTLIQGAGGLKAALTALTGPLGILIAVAAALVAAWITDFGNIREYTATILGTIGELFSVFWGIVQAIWHSGWLNLDGLTRGAWETIQEVFRRAFEAISYLFKAFAALFQGDWSTAWEMVKKSASSIWEGIKALFKSLLNGIVDTLIRVGVRLLHAAKTSFHKILDGASESWDTLMDWLWRVITDPVGTVFSIGEDLFEAGASIFTSLWEGAKSIWNSITSWVSSCIDWLKSKIKFWEDESNKIAKDNGEPIPYPKKPPPPKKGLYRTDPNQSILSGGDTYNFYSPEALTPTKAAREFERAKQELAFGYS